MTSFNIGDKLPSPLISLVIWSISLAAVSLIFTDVPIGVFVVFLVSEFEAVSESINI